MLDFPLLIITHPLTATFWKSFDICDVFLLPMWQPEASKLPFLNILKRATRPRLPDLHASCWRCCTLLHPESFVDVDAHRVLVLFILTEPPTSASGGNIC